MKYLIINADDFGLTQGVNEAVIKAHREGVLTSATLMAGGLAWREAVDLALANPSLGVGVHLTLTALKPVLPRVEVPSLVNREGKFRRQFWRAPLWNKDQVEREWRAQISRIMDAGLKPTHLDSHHHTHLWPGLTDTVCRLAIEFEIPAIRFISPESFDIMGIGGMQRMIASASWQRAQRCALAQPVTVTGIETVPATPEGLGEYLGKLVSGIHELYCHPGSPTDSDLTQISSLTAKRVRETEFLCAGWFREILDQEDTVLVSYRKLGEERV